MTHRMLDLTDEQWRWLAAYADRHTDGDYSEAIRHVVADAMAMDGDHHGAALALIDGRPPEEWRHA